MRSRPRRSWRRFAQAGQAVASTDDESDFGPAEPRIGPAVDEFGSRDVVVNNPVILRDRMLVNRARARAGNVDSQGIGGRVFEAFGERLAVAEVWYRVRPSHKWPRRLVSTLA